MVKLIALYKKPADLETFEKHYFETHVHLVGKIPNLLKSEMAKINPFAGGDAKYYMIEEMYFNDIDKLNEGMASPEGKAFGRDILSFAKDYVEMTIGEIVFSDS